MSASSRSGVTYERVARGPGSQGHAASGRGTET